MPSCDFCGEKGNWKNVLKIPGIVKPDGSDIVVCNDCFNHYTNEEYDKIKLNTGETDATEPKSWVFRIEERGG